MNQFIQITTTTGKRQDAEQIASELISRRLAGCVQVSGPTVSTFRWKDKIETVEEFTCLIKTTQSQFAAIEKMFGEIHPYDIPEIIATPINGSDAYLKWLGQQVAE